MDLLDERNANPDLLYPPFRRVIDQLLARCREAGIEIYLFEGWRSPLRQDLLYARGRSEGGHVVTQARAWESWHQYGLAADLVFGGPGRWTWQGDYKAMGAIAVQLGLEWFGTPPQRFPELAHVQLRFNLNLAEMAHVAKSDGVLAVWSLAAKAEAAAAARKS